MPTEACLAAAEDVDVVVLEAREQVFVFVVVRSTREEINVLKGYANEVGMFWSGLVS